MIQVDAGVHARARRHRIRARLRRIAEWLIPVSSPRLPRGTPPTCSDGPDSAGSWDDYWTERLRARPEIIRHSRCGPIGIGWAYGVMDELARRGGNDLLFVGNGISLLPWAFAHAGYRAVVLDVSCVAIDYLARTTIEETELRYFFHGCESGGKRSFDEARRAGGSVELVCGNLLDASIAPGPFDVAFCERSLQGFPPEQLPAAIRAIDARMAESAECRVLVQNHAPAFDLIEAEFTSLGYQSMTTPPEGSTHRPKRIVQVLMASG